MNHEPIKLLIAEDEQNLSFVLQKELSRQGCQVTVANDGERAIRLAEEQEFDVALLDLMLPGADGITILRALKEQDPAPEVIMMTGHATVDTALSAMKLGAYDYLTKPCQLAQVSELIRKAYEKSQLRRENLVLQSLVKQKVNAAPAQAKAGEHGIVTTNARMRDVLEQVKLVAPSIAPVLINGESGAGKELVARAIHQASPRRDKPFVDLNCAAVAETLVESELFGHEAGAFTSARTRKLGLFELANHGTLFLDEIAELSPQLQSKLLRVLETMSFYRVGGQRKVDVNVRIIAATNVDLGRAVQQGRFRNDLFYRINGIRIMLPALRERQADIPPLAEHFLKTFAPHRELKLSAEAREVLVAYSWPGNVRELRNVIERAVLLAAGGEIQPRDLPVELTSPGARLAFPAPPQAFAARQANGFDHGFGNVSPGANHNGGQSNGYGEPTPAAAEADAVARLEEIERREILSALERTNWHQGRTAELLGISPSTLYRRLRAYKLSKRAVRAQRAYQA
jgi:two-component system, NtrC family, response regulator AtoC